MRKKRVFLGPCEIAGYYANLAKGFSELGVSCDYITYAHHPFNYGGEKPMPRLLRWSAYLDGFRVGAKSLYLVRAALVLLGMLVKGLWVALAIAKYDVFIFGFGQSLTTGNRDLWLLRRLGKVVISNLAHGSEARSVFTDGAYLRHDGSVSLSVEQLVRLQKEKAALYRKFERYSTYVVGAAASSAHFSNNKFINTLALGIPFTASERAIGSLAAEKRSFEPSDHVRILHCPSHPAAKGTPQIKQAISNLIAKGHKIEFVLVHGRAHSEVLDEIQKCDFVVDQLYSDGPLAGFATEAAWFGKPAIVGGYSLDTIRKLAPSGMCPVSKICAPDDIQVAIEELIVDRAERLRLGREAQRFVREMWNCAEVAHRYNRLMDQDVPVSWWLHPDSILLLEGSGQSLLRTKENIRQMVNFYGVASLQLSHRPDLEAAFLKLADIEVRGL
ncbi:glycosyltransferase [Pseudomonas sp. FEMGT703P]|uniref:glycosyltransferase n=1 Tax=Pseudomonas sp. FEMGT703P TaxID=2080764 RepID=UPI00259D1D12|nr:hypothetical protein [Pseudomonas sp. FEMGT703P]